MIGYSPLAILEARADDMIRRMVPEGVLPTRQAELDASMLAGFVRLGRMAESMAPAYVDGQIASIVEGCTGFPCEWEGYLKDGAGFYVRFRGSRLRVYFSVGGNDPLDNPATLDRRLTEEPLHGVIAWDEVVIYFAEALNQRAGTFTRGKP